jgi:tetratricopeptide (TPR) repeat protein
LITDSRLDQALGFGTDTRDGEKGMTTRRGWLAVSLLLTGALWAGEARLSHGYDPYELPRNPFYPPYECRPQDEKKRSEAPSANEQGEKLYKLGKHEEAAELFRKAHVLDCDYFAAVINAASTAAKQGHFGAADNWLRIAYRIAPKETLQKLTSDPNYREFLARGILSDDPGTLGDDYYSKIRRESKPMTFRDEANRFEITIPGYWVDSHWIPPLYRKGVVFSKKDPAPIYIDEFTDHNEVTIQMLDTKDYQRPVFLNARDEPEPAEVIPTQLEDLRGHLLTTRGFAGEGAESHCISYEFAKFGKVYLLTSCFIDSGYEESYVQSRIKSVTHVLRTFRFLE